MSDTSKLTHLGGATHYRYQDPDAAILECFSNQHRSELSVIGLDCPEFTSLCPMTGQPDFGTIHIHYVPGDFCVESKSLKLYLGAFRNHGSFHEDCVNRIADDLKDRVRPRYLRVFGDFRPRGGIAIRPLALRVAPGLSADDERTCLNLLAQFDAVTRRTR
jgi:7-cyano-7-deazaguanine reductase